uniref:Uncharacterized protein n=1 Tax=Crocodylus porosus TaxID=8502 RepID=A0A7M4FTJ2_CROPO
MCIPGGTQDAGRGYVGIPTLSLSCPFFLSLSIFFPSADGVCVFKCLVNRDTEYCRVGKESVLITMGYNSALLQFNTFSNALKRCQNRKKENSVFSQRTDEASAAQYFQVTKSFSTNSLKVKL